MKTHVYEILQVESFFRDLLKSFEHHEPLLTPILDCHTELRKQHVKRENMTKLQIYSSIHQSV
jgi:hypothetical protein